MKKVKLYWTPFALKCLDKIKEYIIQETYSEKTADTYISRLIDRVELLQDFPESGQREEFLKHLEQNSRYLIEGNYKIIYVYHSSKIVITDVFHVKQNPTKIIKRNRRK
ncbi:MAG: type II toxin-antitoxin system RelE/ParE family toxin [Bacteroidetes bacterium]|nr:type II toxin-antitoxin system RelE/ParE family toxin [Bacteroidota bacterium]